MDCKAFWNALYQEVYGITAGILRHHRSIYLYLCSVGSTPQRFLSSSVFKLGGAFGKGELGTDLQGVVNATE
jgi:hypothetical protein